VGDEKEARSSKPKQWGHKVRIVGFLKKKRRKGKKIKRTVRIKRQGGE